MVDRIDPLSDCDVLLPGLPLAFDVALGSAGLEAEVLVEDDVLEPENDWTRTPLAGVTGEELSFEFR